MIPMVAACASIRPARQPVQPYSIQLPQAGGGQVDFEAFRDRVLMVDLFTTWNQTSTVSVTSYAALYRKYHKQGLSVVGVALDEMGEIVVLPYMRGLEIPYPVAVADERLRKGQSPFGYIEATPLLLVFDRKGLLQKIFLGHVPFQKLEKVVVDLLR